MMLRRLLTTGIVCGGFMLPLCALASTPLYEQMRNIVIEDTKREKVDETIIPFLHALYKDTWKISEENIADILRGNATKACNENIELNAGITCQDITQRLTKIANDESRIRALGRTLQASASSYELPISDLPGRAVTLSSDLRAIVNIWSAGTGSIRSADDRPLVRTVSADPEVFTTLLTNLGEALETLDPEQQIGVVWRYQYGVRLTRGDRAPRFPAPKSDLQTTMGTERQYLFKRWDNVEQALMAVWDALNISASPNETVYYVFDKDLIDSTLPENIMIWARRDGDGANNFPFGDVGLQWIVPIEPVQPSLVQDGSNDAIRGGTYPPEPATMVAGKKEPREGEGLCTNPIGNRGYLCRPITLTEPNARCPDTGTKKPDEISLTLCTASGTQLRFSESGPDVCREVSWKDSTPFDPNTQCKVAFRCSDNCAPGLNASGITDDKTADGTIPICISTNEKSSTYLLIHELVHAYQKCNKPVGFDPYEGLSQPQKSVMCCTVEGEAYRTQCAMMERDGVFTNADGSPKLASDGTPFTAETCAESFTNFACGEQQGYNGCFMSKTYPDSFLPDLTLAITNNPKNVPAQCAQAINPETADARVMQMKESVERKPTVCEPGQVNTYQNRIGNNACYIGQCVEMSVELHALSPGQIPTTVGDEIAPWNDPEASSPLGNVLINPTIMQPRLPVYRPELLMRSLESALCQLQGLPPRTPPILCAIDARRQLQLTRVFGAETTAGILDQANQQQTSAQDLLDLAQGIGARAGTEMYGQYLRENNRSFADVLNMANTLLKELQKIDFPTEMCPAGSGLPPDSPST